MTANGDPAYFWARVDIRGPDECWPWIGKAFSPQGYGQVWFDGATRRTHRVAFRLTHGHYPLYTRHSCDNYACCNPAHLLEGTHDENMRDKVERGRQVKGEASPNAKLTEADVRAIRADPRPHTVTAADYRIHPAQVCRLRARQSWKHVQ